MIPGLNISTTALAHHSHTFLIVTFISTNQGEKQQCTTAARARLSHIKCSRAHFVPGFHCSKMKHYVTSLRDCIGPNLHVKALQLTEEMKGLFLLTSIVCGAIILLCLQSLIYYLYKSSFYSGV